MWRVHVTVTPDVVFQHVSALKNVLEFATTRGGAALRSHAGPARWGWGFTTQLRPHSSDRVLTSLSWGTTDPAMEEALRCLTPERLRESAAEAGMPLRVVTWDADPVPDFTHSLFVQPITPLRVLESARYGRRLVRLQLDAAWEAALNRTMSYRFGRPFALRVTLDPAWLWATPSGIRSQPFENKTTHHIVRLPGLMTPFLLDGPPDDLATVWANGCGAGTGMGFGWIQDGLAVATQSDFSSVLAAKMA